MELDIKHLFMALVRKWWIIVLAAILFAIIAIGYTYFFITPVYSSTTEMYVLNNPDRVQMTQSDVNVSAALVPTYVEILKSRTVLTAVHDYLVENYSINYSPDSIRRMLSFSSVTDTEIFKLKVTCANKEHAPIIANAIYEVGKDYLIDITQAGAVKQIDSATVPDGRSAPSYKQNTFVGAVIGALLIIVVILLLTIFDTRVKSMDDLVTTFGLPVFGVIPTVEASGAQKKQNPSVYR